MLSHLLLAGEKMIGADNAGVAEAVMRVFERLNCIQFDPLSVAGRNHDIALQARVKNYRPDICDKLLYTDRRLLDGWDKKMCIIRAADWPWFRPFHKESKRWLARADGPVYPLLESVRAHIKEHGPTTAKMLNIEGEAEWGFGTGNWGSPNPGRVALEAMLSWGELVVANKNNGRKAYDFAEKLLPPEIYNMPSPYESEDAYAEWRVLRRVSSMGLIRKGTSYPWALAAILTTQARNAAISKLLKTGKLIEVYIEGLNAPFVSRPEDWERYAAEGYIEDGAPRFIAPLDNLMWDKQLIVALFGFDYHWEVYDPPSKRKFGYYVLPILAGDEFIGRVEPVYKKGDAAMRVKGLWLERDRRGAVLKALEDYARFLGAEGYAIDNNV